MNVTTHPAHIMLEQLGGRRFIAMTGAKDFVTADNPQPRLIFRLPRNLTRKKGTHFEISLKPDDTYLLVFFRMWKGERIILERFDGAYAEDLQRSFTGMTGLDTHL